MDMNSFYSDTLYPLQDKVLQLIKDQNTPFYLTGGTALSRGYFQHRYSDDLDLFVNSDPNFILHTDKIVNALQKTFKAELTHKSASYYSLRIDNVLKVEFINDVSYHAGNFESKLFFPKVDNVLNILSNKLSALISRDEPKDVVDIWIITKNIAPNWPSIFQDANSKAIGIFPPDIAKRIVEFPLELINLIKWIPDQKPGKQEFKNDLDNICKSIIQ